MISAGIFSKAGSAIPAVSVWSVTVISLTAPFATTTSTVMSPFLPRPVPVYVPSVKPPSEDEVPEQPVNTSERARTAHAIFFNMFVSSYKKLCKMF